METRVPNHDLYRLIRHNIQELIDHHPDAADDIVPACPEWRVHDLVAHLLYICEQGLALVTGRATGPVQMSGAPSGGRGLPELLSIWQERGTELDRLVARTDDPRAGMLVHDAFSHELDLRVAVGAPVPDGHPGYACVLDLPVGGFFERVAELGLPDLRIETRGREWTSGEPATAVVTADRHDLYRSLTGRRTHEQIAALSWSADPTPWLPAFTRGPFRPPKQPTEEFLARP